MNLPNAKDLKKLAQACRKAGIKHFRTPEYEFTLTDEVPTSNYKKRSDAPNRQTGPIIDPAFQSEEISQDALLMWSVSEDLGEESGEA